MTMTYKAVISKPTEMSETEIVEYAVKRARSLGYIVEDNPAYDIREHTAQSDGWDFFVATIEARIPRGVEAHPAGQALGILPAARRNAAGKRFTGQGST